MTSFKNINIGSLIEQRVNEYEIDISRICNFFSCSEESIRKMYQSATIETELLLKWCKLLEYDFFRIYSQHLILFSPQSNFYTCQKEKPSSLPQFRKNIYTKEVIDFIVDLIDSGEKNMNEVIERYGIPKTTLHRWTVKYRAAENKRHQEKLTS